MWLVFKTVDGKKIRRVFAPLEWRTLQSWVNNNQLSFNLFKSVDQVPQVGLINPDTGKYMVLPSDFPDLKPFGGAAGDPYHFLNTSLVFDPRLQLVVYPKKTDWNERYIVLWDLQSKKAIASLQDAGYFGHMPVWSKDGKYFLVAVTPKGTVGNDTNNTPEWFRISREGEIQQLTHFATLFNEIFIGKGNISPDGHFLAFGLNKKSNTDLSEQLTILNLETLEVTNYCIPGSSPIWSLDSRYVAVEDISQDPIRTILIDLEENRAIEIGNQVYPAGWLAEP